MYSRVSRTVAAAAVVGLTGLVLAGCGGGAKGKVDDKPSPTPCASASPEGSTAPGKPGGSPPGGQPSSTDGGGMPT
ncbi:MAG: hypothetical protein ACRDUA_15305, partial [Micromonosporaceae bacterium]